MVKDTFFEGLKWHLLGMALDGLHFLKHQNRNKRFVETSGEALGNYRSAVGKARTWISFIVYTSVWLTRWKWRQASIILLTQINTIENKVTRMFHGYFRLIVWGQFFYLLIDTDLNCCYVFIIESKIYQIAASWWIVILCNSLEKNEILCIF